MNRKIIWLIIALTTLPILGLGTYFALLVYRPFESRTVPPTILIEEYDGPGSLKRERENAAAKEKSDPPSTVAP